MRQLSPAGQKIIDEIARRHGFSADATLAMLDAVIAGNGSMAQFDHPEFAGSGQWMRGGMTMVSDLFDHRLKSRVDALCSELADLAATQPDLVRSGSFQSQRQGGAPVHERTRRHEGAAVGSGASSLFVAPAAGSGTWWPSDLGSPSSTGEQNGVRYAYFPDARRLAIDVGGSVTVYDMLDHRIGGFSQQRSVGGTLGFSSQHGLIDVASLPVVSAPRESPRAPVAPEAPVAREAHRSSSAPPPSANLAGGHHDVFAAIEKLADLRTKGILSEAEFSAKKAELLGRI